MKRWHLFPILAAWLVVVSGSVRAEENWVDRTLQVPRMLVLHWTGDTLESNAQFRRLIYQRLSNNYSPLPRAGEGQGVRAVAGENTKLLLDGRQHCAG